MKGVSRLSTPFCNFEKSPSLRTWSPSSEHQISLMAIIRLSHVWQTSLGKIKKAILKYQVLFTSLNISKCQSVLKYLTLYGSLISTLIICSLGRYMQVYNTLASLCSWASFFESYLVANPEDRFSHVTFETIQDSYICSFPVIVYSETCLKRPLKNRQNKGLKDRR